MSKFELQLLKKILWVCYLVTSLVFIQGAGIHVHVYNHSAETSSHAHDEHHGQAHLGYETLDTGHADQLAEIDLSQQGFLKNMSFSGLFMAFFMAVVILLLPRLLTRLSWQRYCLPPLSAWPFSLRPPSRAPPL